MREHINLLIYEKGKQEGPDYKRLAILMLLFTPMIILLLAYGFEKRRAVLLKKELAGLTSRRDTVRLEIARLTGEIDATIKGREGIRLEEEKRLDLINKLVKERISWSEIMRELSLRIPEDVWLTDLESKDSKRSDRREVRIVGFAKSHPDITRFITLLEGSSYFSEISLIYAQKDEEPAGRVNFEVVCLIEARRLSNL